MFAQFANVRLIMRAGVVVNQLVAVIRPNDPSIPDWEAVFEFIASADGLYTVELEVCNQWGCNTTKPTASIVIGFGTLTGISTELGELITQETATTDLILQE